ncbi:ArdC-like ssDNA-binding domain-containing protein [Arcobacter sp. LA11]|uniref:ArdC-like ssDNA-binding domain-containing protein n=1 Tax=Arcobacter sp. LA11 TaxID=1898176 RepID=UPI000932D294|nr:ArdC-like ssDNA-binding domain-containing protein [Arcobacter sp. LA11]
MSKNENKQIDTKQFNIEKDLEELIKKLDNPKTEEIVKEFYSNVARFNNYSFNNIWLLNSQAQLRAMDLSYVSSFKQWQNMEVKVNKGRQALKVFAPKQNYKVQRDENNKAIKDSKGRYKYILDNNNQKIKTDISFILVPVFDVSQTNAKELEKIKPLSYSNPYSTISKEMLQELYEEVKKKFNVSIEEKKLKESLGGYYQISNKHIVINSNSKKSLNSKVGTLFHELGHHLMHGQDNYKKIHLDTSQKEGERESVAYIVSKHIGITQNSELYLKSWDRDANNMKEHLKKIVDTSKEIMKEIDFETIFENELKRDNLTNEYLDSLIEKKKEPILNKEYNNLYLN